jgi:hypothetical protein
VGAPPGYHVEHLRAPGSAGEVAPAILGSVFRAPWRAVSLVHLEAGETFGERDLLDSEAMVFVTAGNGTATLHHGPVALRQGISLTLFKDERLELRADDGSLEFFFAEMGAA